MINVIKERIVGNARHELVTNFSGGYCLPWWAISKVEHVPNSVQYPRFRKVFRALSTANKGKPIFVSRQNFIKKLVVGTDGTVWFNPSSFSLSSTCMAGNHPDDPFYDPNGSKGSAFVNGENILVGGANLEFSYRVKDEDPHATIDLSAVSIEEFNEFFESSQFSHPAFNPKEFNKKFIELLERGCNTKLKLPTCHEGSSVQNLEFGEYSQRVIFRDFESNEVVSNKYYSAAVLMEGVVLGMDNGFLKQRVVKQLKLKMADDGTSYTECLIGNYPESAPVDLVELGGFIRKKPSLGLLDDRLFRARLGGIGQSRLSTFVYDLSQESGLDEAFSENLEDMAAALEGHCCSSYILHPSHF